LDIMKMVSGNIDVDRGAEIVGPHSSSSPSSSSPSPFSSNFDQTNIGISSKSNHYLAKALRFHNSYGSSGYGMNINSSPTFHQTSSPPQSSSPQSQPPTPSHPSSSTTTITFSGPNDDYNVGNKGGDGGMGLDSDEIWSVDVSDCDQISVFYHFLAQYWSQLPPSLQNSTPSTADNVIDNGNPINSSSQMQTPQQSQQSQSQQPQHSDSPLTPLMSKSSSDSDDTITTHDHTTQTQGQQVSITTETTPTTTSTPLSNYQTERWWFLGLLCVAWFIVAFASSGFSSFLPTLWNALIPEEKRKTMTPDINYIISAIYATVQVPAGFANIIAMSRWFPPRVLLIGAIIQ
jgi:hypothetical protein